MTTIDNRLSSVAIAVFLLFSFSVASAAGKFDVDFYNVGQGHCVVARSAKNGVLIIDAGSSSTVGVDEVTVKTGQILHLAKQIFSSIDGDLNKGSALSFIITHADKDHLNLAQPIIVEVINKYAKNNKIRFILGNQESQYSKGAGKELLEFIKNEKILYSFGTDFRKANNKDLFWTPPPNFTFEGGDGENITFLSVKSDIKVPTKKDKATGQPTALPDEKKKNASSIVVKIEGGGRSVMITGDKTRAEITLLIGLYKTSGKIKELKSDVLLATHHGSEEDFSEDWMKMVNPSYLVVSSGTSAFFHPRPEAICSKEVLDNLIKTQQQPWHPIRSYGNLPSIQYSDNLLIPVGSGGRENFRSTPYSYSMTNAGIYVTADQGTVKFSFNNGVMTVAPSKQNGDNDFDKAFKNFLTSQKDDLNDIVIYPPNTLSKGFFKEVLPLCSSLKNLDLSHCTAKDKHTDNIIHVVTTLTNLSTLNMSTNSMRNSNKKRIGEAWGPRGLSL